jgi:release factor glutamine methyltransferase
VQLKSALTDAITRLAAEQVPSPRLNAELLLMFTLNCDRAYFHAHPERELTANELSRYEAALAQRARGVPAQYITGHQEFWGMDLIVTPAVLIPRPETEHVVETVLELSRLSPGDTAAERRKNAAHGASRGSSRDNQPAPEGRKNPHAQTNQDADTDDPLLRIADVGTGSGCIALALAKELPQAEIHATDISPAALEIARANAARHQLEKRIHFQEADLLAGFENDSFDFIISNPPYVGESEADQVQLEVRKFEPRNAVFAGPTGLELIERLIPQARAVLKPKGWLVFEISGTIVENTRELLHGWDEVLIKPDLQSIPRVVQARKPSAF